MPDHHARRPLFARLVRHTAHLAACACCATLLPAAVAQDSNVTVHIALVNATVAAAPTAATEPPASSYFATTPGALRATYPAVYPGIDLACYGDDHCFEYAFRLTPGADPALIALRVDDAVLAGRTANDDLYYRVANCEVYQHPPTAFAVGPDGARALPAAYNIVGASATSVALDDYLNAWSAARNDTDLVLVPAGGQPGGPDYDFYIGKVEVSNDQFLRFLNDAEQNPRDLRGTNMLFAADGSVFMHPDMRRNRDELFAIGLSRLEYHPDRVLGSRYDHVRNPDGSAPYANHPATGVSWFGAVKYCNWLTLAAGRGPAERCYHEGNTAAAWAPVTATNWANGFFTPAERRLWLALKGFRLPMINPGGDTIATNAFNEFFKAAAWNGTTNQPFGFGRTSASPLDANFRVPGSPYIPDTTPVAFFNGSSFLGDQRTFPNQNQYGLYDTSGNAGEWTSDVGRDGYPGSRVVAGGSYADEARTLQVRSSAPPQETRAFGGFRVVGTYLEEAGIERLEIHVLYCFDCGEGVLPPVEPLLPLTTASTIATPLTITTPGSVPPEWLVTPFVAGALPHTPLIYKPIPSVEIPTPIPGGGGGGGEPFVPTPTPTSPPVPVVTYTLNVNSMNPDSGVPMTVTPADNSGTNDGVTAFQRTYNSGTSVTVTAPTNAAGNRFLHWLLNGVRISVNPTVTVQMLSDLTLTAVYETPPPPPVPVTLRVSSENPFSGVSIQVNPADTNGFTDGSTTFERVYPRGTTVTLNAPGSAGGNNFLYWELFGVAYSANTNLTLTLLADTQVTAVYGVPQPPIDRTLTVQSSHPDSGVTIVVDRPDNNGDASGDTTFQRIYSNGTPVTLTAPLTAFDPATGTTNTFVGWELNGRPYAIDPTISLTMLADVTVRAIYEPPPLRTLTVSSINPDSGVTITVDHPDTSGNTDGDTTFTRLYYDGTTVTVTAPATVTTNTFVRWLLNGVPYSTNLAVTITMLADLELTAVFTGPPPPDTVRLTVNSVDPDAGVPIVVNPGDYYGNTNGVTTFTRDYLRGETVTLTAPPTAFDPDTGTANVFDHWEMNGVEYSRDRTVSLTLTANTTMTAVYVRPPESRSGL